MEIMNNYEFRYQPLTQEELRSVWEKHKVIIESFIKHNGYDSAKVYINENTVMAIVAKVHQRREYFEYFHGLDMSECKEAALICFWYIKLRPLCAISKQEGEECAEVFDYINEKLAIYYIIVILRGMLQGRGGSTERLDKIPQNYLRELAYSFKYRDISKEALILLVESMAVFLGLNPYSDGSKSKG